jgi:hypothetical protein
MMANLTALRWLLPLLLLSACSEGTKTETAKPPAKAPEPLTGRQAFQRMYPQARVWAADAQPLQVLSVNLAQVKAEPGKAGAWQVIFVSPSRGKSRMFTYSAVEADGNLHEGVFGAIEESYTGSRGPAFPFQIAAIKVDSDQAYDVAARQSKEYLKKNPDKPVVFLLEQTNKFANLTWRVIWGNSVGSSDYSVYVDATLGTFLEKVH